MYIDLDLVTNLVNNRDLQAYEDATRVQITLIRDPNYCIFRAPESVLAETANDSCCLGELTLRY